MVPYFGISWGGIFEKNDMSFSPKIYHYLHHLAELEIKNRENIRCVVTYNRGPKQPDSYKIPGYSERSARQKRSW